VARVAVFAFLPQAEKQKIPQIFSEFRGMGWLENTFSHWLAMRLAGKRCRRGERYCFLAVLA